MIDPSISIGNFIGPGLTGIGLFVAFYFQSKSARAKELDTSIKPLNDQLIEVKTRTENYVPRDEVDTRFHGLEAAQLALGMDHKALSESVISLRIQQGKTEQAMSSVNTSIAKLEEGQKAVLAKLDELLMRKRVTDAQ